MIISGMLCAYNYPNFEKFMKHLESTSESVRERWWKLAKKLILAGVLLLALIAWYETVMRKEKLSYNALHPYTSWIPIISFIILR